MKKMYTSLISLVLVFCVLIGGVAVMTADLLADSDNVVWTPEVIYGDLSALEGLSVLSRHVSMQALLWETSMELGQELTYDTALSYHFFDSVSDAYPSVGKTHTGISIFDKNVYIVPFEPYGNSYGIAAEYERLYDTIPAGGTAVSEYAMRDYTDTVPMYFLYDLPDVHPPQGWTDDENQQEPWQKTAQAVLDYFAIPLKGDPILRFTVVREGNSRRNNVEVIGAPKVTSESFATKEAVYIAFRITGDADTADQGAIAEGHGIYRIPLDKSQPGPEQLRTDEITRFYPLDPNVNVWEMKPDPVTGHLLLLTEQEGELSLRVINRTDGHLLGITPLQSIDLTRYTLTVQKDVVLLIDRHRIQVLSRREDGSYGLGSTIYPQDEYEWMDPVFMTGLNFAFAYDGKRLAILSDDADEGMRIYVLEDGVVTAHVLLTSSLHKEQRYFALCPPLTLTEAGIVAEWRD